MQEQERPCADCEHFRIGDAMGEGDGWCVADIQDGPMEWAPVNNAEDETCPRWERVRIARG